MPLEPGSGLLEGGILALLRFSVNFVLDYEHGRELQSMTAV